MVTQEEIENEQYQSYKSQNDMSRIQQEELMNNEERNLIKQQLDLSEELERIEHLLRGHVIKHDADKGERYWAEPDDPDMIVLSEYGIQLILNAITWYINKNTLLSNYEDDVINEKMEDFSKSLVYAIFMEYEKVFQYPSLEDCQNVLEVRIKNKIETQKFTNKLRGIIKSDEDIRKEIMKEIEVRLGVELVKIKEQITKNKLKRFDLLIRCVQDSVHSTYLRAWKGQERRTLREHINITESHGGTSQPQQKGGFSPFAWITGRR